jgi:hypothetical protein
MRIPIARLAAGAALLLSACNQPLSPVGAGKPPVPSSPEQPSFWSAATQDEQGKITKTMLICADKAVHESFSRPMPSPNGRPCAPIAPPVVSADRYAARCKSNGRHYDIQASKSGDPAKDFVVTALIRSEVTGRENLTQTLHYRLLGACPGGWNVGDSAAPGDRRVVNSLSGAARDLSAPVQYPTG